MPRSPRHPDTPITPAEYGGLDGLPEAASLYRMTIREPGRARRRTLVTRAEMLRDLVLFQPGGHGIATAQGRVIRLRIRIPGLAPSERIYRPYDN